MKQIIIKFRNGKKIVTNLSNSEAFKTELKITMTIGAIYMGLVLLANLIGGLIW